MQAAFDARDGDVRKRDVREIVLEGDFPRDSVRAVNDVLFALAAAISVLALLTPFMRLSPTGLWGVPAAAAVVAGSVWLRRTLRSSVRAQRMTAAVMAVTLYVTGLILAVWAIETLRR